MTPTDVIIKTFKEYYTKEYIVEIVMFHTVEELVKGLEVGVPVVLISDTGKTEIELTKLTHDCIAWRYTYDSEFIECLVGSWMSKWKITDEFMPNSLAPISFYSGRVFALQEEQMVINSLIPKHNGIGKSVDGFCLCDFHSIVLRIGCQCGGK